MSPDLPISISMADAEMAIETCTNIPENERDQCYVAFGVDGKAVEEYFSIVYTMEFSLYMESHYKNNTDPIWLSRFKEKLMKIYYKS